MNRKDIFMTGFKSKLGFAFTRKDMEEFETIIDFYEKENERLKDKIDKAIEYIKNIDKFEERLNDDTRIYMIQDVDVDEIERILKEKLLLENELNK